MIIKILLSSIMLCLGRGEFAFALTDPPPIKAKRVINRALHEWESQQVEEPCVLVNPKNPNQLIMFYSGVPASNQSKAYIGKAWASVDAPLDWHEDKQNPIFKPSEDGWDSGSIRLDSVVYVAEEDSYYIYYSGTQGAIQDRIGLAIVPAGADGYSGITPRKILRYDSKPVLVPENYSPFNETMVSQGAVMREWNVSTSKWEWYMYYS